MSNYPTLEERVFLLDNMVKESNKRIQNLEDMISILIKLMCDIHKDAHLNLPH